MRHQASGGALRPCHDGHTRTPVLIRQEAHVLSMCDVDLAVCDVRLLAATAVYITRKTHQRQIEGHIWAEDQQDDNSDYDDGSDGDGLDDGSYSTECPTHDRWAHIKGADV
uniref:Uncharacterized protein n=1 Tax=Vitrella brassicaformis TaxID=1169539 RepID=A0A7S1K722_9ALVE|mmetsp:Transcript_40883/g.102153  ORF Transcript_40883/g.102153 Transcript_40883/m.102153 type:complete len:111 (+) Transcript_40883:152-484(+)